MTTTQETKGIKAFLIARVSDPSQREALPAQEIRIKDYAERNHLDGTLYGFDETAFKDDREKFMDIVKQIENCSQFCIVVFDKVDRFTRDCTADVVRTLKGATKNGQIELHFPSDGLFVRKNSPASDWFRLDMGMALGGYYSAAISDNVKRKIEQKLHDKEWPGKAPIGYLNVNIEENGRVIGKDVVLDPLRSRAIIKMFELRLQRLSYRVIARVLREDGLTSNSANPRPIGQSTVECSLKNPFYYGVMRYDGKLYPHRYQPLIDKQTFDEAQKITEARNGGGSKPKSDTKRLFTFNGVLKCAYCGCSISSYTCKGHTYMQCSKAKGRENCKQPHLKEADVEPEMLKIIEKVKLNEALIDQVIAELKEKHDNEQFYCQSVVRQTQLEYEKLKKRLAVAYEDRMDGRITVDEYDKFATKYKAEMEILDKKMVQITSDDKTFIIDSSYLLKLAYYAPILFKSSKVELKNKLLKILLSNLKINENHLDFKRWQPFDVIASCTKSQNWLPGLDLNQ
ncbi:MAG: recombinase family protein [Candidatus Nomurabacteria bacterium]|nr:recombinase family protein [Candidatus Nomurabacteria bacterium]